MKMHGFEFPTRELAAQYDWLVRHPKANVEAQFAAGLAFIRAHAVKADRGDTSL